MELMRESSDSCDFLTLINLLVLGASFCVFSTCSYFLRISELIKDKEGLSFWLLLHSSYSFLHLTYLVRTLFLELVFE